MGNNSLFAVQKDIDPDRSCFTIHVGKSGLLAAAGHEHIVRAFIKDGSIDDGQPSHVAFRVDAARLTVLQEDHQPEVQHSMQEKVLESARFPEISFRSDLVQSIGTDRWTVLGVLSLHGVDKPVRLSVRKTEGMYVGTSTIKQTDFGIQQISVAWGAVKVKDELKIDFLITTK